MYNLFFFLFLILQIVGVNAAPLVFTFGFLRMGSSDVETVGALAGYLATVQYANTYNIIPGVQFRLNVTTIPCQNYTACRAITAANSQQVRDFLAAMPGYSAVLKPNFLLADTIVDEATRLGGIPVLDADDIRMSSFTKGAEHIINFNHNWQRQMDHLFTYMMQTGRCAKSGILYGVNNSDYAIHISAMKKLFTNGGFASPPSADFTTMTDAQIRSFFGEPNRKCFVVLGSYYFNKYLLYRLGMLGINPNNFNFYATSTIAGDSFDVFGSIAPYKTVNFVHWTPQIDSARLQQAFQEWLPNTAGYAHLFAVGQGEALPTTVGPSTTQGYLVMMFMLQTIRAAVSRELFPNTTGPLPLRWSLIVDAFYLESRDIEGIKFSTLVRSCPKAPAQQVCFCNTVTRTSYMYGINTTTAIAYAIYDDYSKGQRGIASLEFPSTCGYFASAWSYPITGLAIYPSILMGSSYRTAEEEAYAVYDAAYGYQTLFVNYAATAPTRALRYAAYDLKSNESLQVALDKYIESIKPFVIYGSMTETIGNPRGILTLASNMMQTRLEDPPLVPHDQWRWDILRLQPTIADYIHGLVAYYVRRKYENIYAIATSQREAELISMSFATWGFNVPVSSIVVSVDPYEWSAFATNRLLLSKTYVIAASQHNNNSVIQSIMVAAAQATNGILAIATSVTNIYDAKPLVVFASSSLADVVFGYYKGAWWTAGAQAAVPLILRNYSLNPRYHQAMLGLDVAKQLYVQAYFDYATTAADVLYRTSVISASETSFGPFSNTTCTTEEIAANTRDRSCQCTKGVRRIYVLSMRNYISGGSSSRTASFSWTMTTCGIVYTPYVAPTEPPQAAEAASLSAGSISGIAVGASLALLLLVGGLVANSLFFGRNNRAAPKDSSQPFAIVFTDIQSSTALWARAPAAMSEAVDQHHHLMRKALRRNGGYEVKTVGDSFMVAFKDPVDATRFALDIQILLHSAEWSSELDATYIELIAEAEVAAANSTVEDISTQSEGANFHRRQSAKLPDTISNCNSIHSNAQQMAFQRNKLSFIESPRLAESPRACESPRLTDYHMPSVIVTHSRTPNQSMQLSRPPAFGGPEDSAAHYSDDEFFGAAGPWHGLRVRIGIHFGSGDIRKDPVSQGYDYYGTVVNTSARVEGVGHGGQTLLTDVVFEMLPSGFAKNENAVIIALGPQPLRGLDAPVNMYQMVPASLQGRRFPPLRLHIEKDTEESSVTETATATGTAASETPELLISRICAGKQFANVPQEEILDRYHYFLATFGPSTDKYKASVIAKLGESWGFEKAAKVVQTGGIGRTRLLVSLIAKVTKAFHSTQKGVNGRRHRTVTHTSLSAGNNHETMSMSEAIKSIHPGEMNSVSDGR